MNVLIINHYAGNKGDRAVLHFVIRELKRIGVSKIIASVHDRSLWIAERRLLGSNVHLVPWGWNVEMPQGTSRFALRLWWERQRLYKKALFPFVRNALLTRKKFPMWRWLCNSEFAEALRSADFVVSTGGHRLTTILAPDAVSEGVYDMAMTLIAGKPLVLWSQSFGPFIFSCAQNRAFMGEILRACSEIFSRDATSVEELRAFGVKTDMRQTYESVIGLNDTVTAHVPPSRREQTVGISIYAAQRRNPEEHKSYVEVFAALVDHAYLAGYAVRFFPMEIKGTGPDDRILIHDILANARNGFKCQVMNEDFDTYTHMAEVAKCRVFVGHKTHSVIFALTVGTPVVALAYHNKTRDFMTQYDLDYNVIPDEQLDAVRLIAIFDRVCRDADEIAAKQAEVSHRFGFAVRKDFSNMVARHGRTFGHAA